MGYTKRQIEIIKQIMNNISGITGEKLARHFGLSSRTIRNEILQINQESPGVPSIRASKRNGYYMTDEDQEAFRTLFKKQDGAYSIAKECRGYAILGLVLEHGNMDLYDLEDLVYLSQSAIKAEILKLKRQLKESMEEEVLFVEGNRLFLTEDELKIRFAICNIIKYEVQSNMDYDGSYLARLFPGCFRLEEYKMFLKAVKSYFYGHQVQVSDASLYLAANSLFATHLRKRQNHELEKRMEHDYEVEVLVSLMSHLRLQGIEYSREDEAMLQVFLYSIRFVQEDGERKAGGLCHSILQVFCQDVLNKYSFDLYQSDDLFDNMALHLEYLIRRIETGTRIDNPILKDIKTQYPYAYEIAMMLVPVMFKHKGILIRDEEIAYMALYVAYFLDKVNRRLRAVAVNARRQSVWTLALNWLADNFQNQIEIVKTLPNHQLGEYVKEHSVDLIISTTELNDYIDLPVFCISNIPDRQDYNALNAMIRRIRMSKRFAGIIKRYFNTRGITIFEETTTFEQMIHTLSENLERMDKIQNAEVFAQDVCTREINYPTDIGESMMIPHPLMTFAKETTVAVAVLRHPLSVQGRDIKVIFLLAIEAKPNDDVSILFEFFKQMAVKEILVNELYQAENEEDFLNRLTRVSASLELY